MEFIEWFVPLWILEVYLISLLTHCKDRWKQGGEGGRVCVWVRLRTMKGNYYSSFQSVERESMLRTLK